MNSIKQKQKEQCKQTMKQRISSLWKTNKIDQHLPKLTKRHRENNQIDEIRIKRGHKNKHWGNLEIIMS